MNHSDKVDALGTTCRKRPIHDETDEAIAETLQRSTLRPNHLPPKEDEDMAISDYKNTKCHRQEPEHDAQSKEEAFNGRIEISEITKLSLEAIFHPKFENENRHLQSIRMEMKERVSRDEGYLEVTLKHSGNLLLWSGDQRFFSKNATSNAFTYVGEVLLRQHFNRSWYSEEEHAKETLETSTATTVGDVKYRECSDHVEKNRLTLAFEAVTSVLGHHGDLPKKDFLILTAVADRRTPRFYSTVELLELAQRFRLPHNDLWIYSTRPSVDCLFHLYDTTRETALAGDTVAALSDSANAHVSSMYPHVDFQGPILEGIVIRYVAYTRVERQQQEGRLRLLESMSQAILERVPLTRPMCFELYSNSNSKILSLDIRRTFDDCIAMNGFASDLTTRFGDAVCQVLQATDERRRTTHKLKIMDCDIPGLARSLIEKDVIDKETLRIAKIIVNLEEQNAGVRYGVVQEDAKRLLCTLHVLHDKTFVKFQKRMQHGDMQLFRGFTFELGKEDIQHSSDENHMHSEIEHAQHLTDSDSDSIMLKMKFLPYMVRTFCCRNGLQTLAKQGPMGFAAYTWRQMTSWDLSEEAMARWQPFFRSWATYARNVMESVPSDYTDTSLPPLREEFYLTHLQHFIALYENGKIRSSDGDKVESAASRGLVIVVALEKERAVNVAEVVGNNLCGAKKFDDVNDDSIGWLPALRTHCLIVCATLDNHKLLLKRLKANSIDVFIIFVGCDNQSIDDYSSQSNKHVWKHAVNALTRICDSTRIAHIVPLIGQGQTAGSGIDPDLALQQRDDLKNLIEHLREFSADKPTSDTNKSILVFFPGIPGCGKSAISGMSSQDVLKKFLNSLEADGKSQYKLSVLVGDKVKKKYWPMVSKILDKQPFVLIADKNAPRATWSIVGNSAGNAIVVPVVPDSRALCTTRIIGTRDSTGNMSTHITHSYPFSLHYLAVCMSRVMARPAKSHIGGLDSSLNKACLVVIMFFGLYRSVASDDFVESIQTIISKSGSVCSTNPIILPFFANQELPDLPEDLSNTLIEAVQLFYGCEREGKDALKLLDSNPVVQDMERRLRDVMRKHTALLFSLASGETETQLAFVNQLVAQIESSTDHAIVDADATAKAPITLVSIDVCSEDLHKALRTIAVNDPSFSDILRSIGIDPLQSENYLNAMSFGLEKRTHVTMAHPSRASQQEMRSKFDSLIGKSVNIIVTGMLLSKRAAALAVQVASKTSDGIGVPRSTNDFVHVTLWRTAGCKAVESNSLPDLVADQHADNIVFKIPFEIQGTFSYWM